MKCLKKVILFLLSFSIIASLAACGPDYADTRKNRDVKDRHIKIANMNFDGHIITFKANFKKSDSSKQRDAAMDEAVNVLQRRLDDRELSDVSVKVEKKNIISVSVPDDYDVDFDELTEYLAKAAVLEFRDADGIVILTGDDIESAESVYGQTAEDSPQHYYVSLTLKPEAVTKFAEATKAAAKRASEGKNFIGIYLDDVEQSAPIIGAEYASTGIESKEVIITIGEGSEPGVDAAEASKNLARVINSGCLPLTLTLISCDEI